MEEDYLMERQAVEAFARIMGVEEQAATSRLHVSSWRLIL